jgi:hypothetical protein
MSILPLSQQRLWPELRPAVELGFVLYGGTAISLRCGHRISEDFDFFSDNNLDSEKIKSSFSFAAHSIILQESSNTLTFQVKFEGTHYVKVSFFGGIGFGRVGEPELSEDGILYAASLDDLMATKVKVVLQRAAAKDYLDVAAMLSAGINLARGLASAELFFGNTFQPSESLKALCFFEDGDLSTLPKDIKQTLVNAVKTVSRLPDVSILSKSLSGYGLSVMSGEVQL